MDASVGLPTVNHCVVEKVRRVDVLCQGRKQAPEEQRGCGEGKKKVSAIHIQMTTLPCYSAVRYRRRDDSVDQSICLGVEARLFLPLAVGQLKDQ